MLLFFFFVWNGDNFGLDGVEVVKRGYFLLDFFVVWRCFLVELRIRNSRDSVFLDKGLFFCGRGGRLCFSRERFVGFGVV